MSTNKLSLNSSILSLYKSKKPSKSASTLYEAGIKTINDLLWIMPSKIYYNPTISSFKTIEVDQLFKGFGKIISTQKTINWKGRGKRGIQLYNLNVTVQDTLSSKTLNLKWFNCYPSLIKKLEGGSYILFTGQVTLYKNQFQITNPEYSLEDETFDTSNELDSDLVVKYPTIAKVSGAHLKKVIDKIPKSLWDDIDDHLPAKIIEKRKFMNLTECFQIIHGKLFLFNKWSSELFNEAKRRLVYEELFQDQIKVLLRRKSNQLNTTAKMSIKEQDIDHIKNIFPYTLTQDQSKVLDDITQDLTSEYPMMRLIQGDVGSGKTSVAIAATYFTIKNKYQVAFMCPTESLALQHYNNLKKILPDFNIQLLLGSHSKKEKNEIYNDLSLGVCNLIIGTHSLFQKDVEYKNLGLCIIDEQHKFGVNQRIQLLKKSEHPNCLILTATPIPRSLSLTQYGDLDISIIKTMPSNRKGIKTKIVNNDNFENFLRFIKTRLSLNEQVYVVTPAIYENPDFEMVNVEKVYERFKHFFKEHRIASLHGKQKTEEKALILDNFKAHKLDIIISTSVIEVGIDIPNATTIAIMDPERFGLSSLHQLRGRVGRGDKPGFCFLVSTNELPKQTINRLKVIENTTDGFKIAEEDLKIRGEGDLFGHVQSGLPTKKIANIYDNQEELLWSRKDCEELFNEDNSNTIESYKKLFITDDYISNTI